MSSLENLARVRGRDVGLKCCSKRVNRKGVGNICVLPAESSLPKKLGRIQSDRVENPILQTI